jgi:putative transposase
VRFGETLSLSGLRPSVGSVGDAYDNALAETTIGLYKNECIRVDSPFRRGPLRTMSDVELTTADYVAWYNQSRLMHRLGRVPPTEAEAHYYSGHVTDQPAGSGTPRVHETRDGSCSHLGCHLFVILDVDIPGP